MDVYHKEQLVTKEEVDKVAAYGKKLEWRRVWRWEWRWKYIALTKDASTAARIADILDTYGYNDVAQHIRGKCVYSCVCV